MSEIQNLIQYKEQCQSLMNVLSRQISKTGVTDEEYSSLLKKYKNIVRERNNIMLAIENLKV